MIDLSPTGAGPVFLPFLWFVFQLLSRGGAGAAGGLLGSLPFPWLSLFLCLLVSVEVVASLRSVFPCLFVLTCFFSSCLQRPSFCILRGGTCSWWW